MRTRRRSLPLFPPPKEHDNPDNPDDKGEQPDECEWIHRYASSDCLSVHLPPFEANSCVYQRLPLAFSITPTTRRGPTSRTHVTFNSIIPQRNCVHKNYFSLSPVPDDATSPNRGFMRTYIRLDDASTHARHVGPVELPGPVHLCRRARLPPARRFLRKPFRHGKSSCYSRTRPLLKHPYMRNLITKSERLEEPRP